MFAVAAGTASALTISADRADAVYALGEEAVFTVRSDKGEAGPYAWQLNNFGDKVFSSGEAALETNGTFSVKGGQTEPGFLRLDVWPKGGGRSQKTMWGVVFDGEKIVPGTPYPADFTTFWKNAIAAYDREVTEPIRVTEVARDNKTVLYELRIPSKDKAIFHAIGFGHDTGRSAGSKELDAWINRFK